MSPIFIFLIFIVLSTFIKGIEQTQNTKKVIKPEVAPKAKIRDEDIKSHYRAPISKESSSSTRADNSTKVYRKVLKSKSNVKVTKKSVLNGIVMAEILSPPKCKR